MIVRKKEAEAAKAGEERRLDASRGRGKADMHPGKHEHGHDRSTAIGNEISSHWQKGKARSSGEKEGKKKNQRVPQNRDGDSKDRF